MPERDFEFFAICDRGHRPLHRRNREELKRELEAAVLPLRCGICGAFREATPGEIARLRLLIEQTQGEGKASPETRAPADTVRFSVDCGGGHDPAYTWNRGLLEQAVVSGSLRLYCSGCRRFVDVSPAEVERLRALLEVSPQG